MKPTLFVLALALLVFGCSKSQDTGDNSSPTPNTKGSPAKTTEMPVSGTDNTAAVPTSGPYKPVNEVFTKNCIKCHGGSGRAKGGIDLTSYDKLMKGGEDGPLVIAEKPDQSRLIMALHGKGAKQMPPRGPLSDADIKVVADWIKNGAKNG